jgi:hypothetical protein
LPGTILKPSADATAAFALSVNVSVCKKAVKGTEIVLRSLIFRGASSVDNGMKALSFLMSLTLRQRDDGGNTDLLKA